MNAPVNFLKVGIRTFLLSSCALTKRVPVTPPLEQPEEGYYKAEDLIFNISARCHDETIAAMKRSWSQLPQEICHFLHDNEWKINLGLTHGGGEDKSQLIMAGERYVDEIHGKCSPDNQEIHLAEYVLNYGYSPRLFPEPTPVAQKFGAWSKLRPDQIESILRHEVAHAIVFTHGDKIIDCFNNQLHKDGIIFDPSSDDDRRRIAESFCESFAYVMGGANTRDYSEPSIYGKAKSLAWVNVFVTDYVEAISKDLNSPGGNFYKHTMHFLNNLDSYSPEIKVPRRPTQRDFSSKKWMFTRT